MVGITFMVFITFMGDTTGPASVSQHCDFGDSQLSKRHATFGKNFRHTTPLRSVRFVGWGIVL